MKRSAALAPLSRDHHLALVIARDLARSADGEEADRAAAAFVRFLRDDGLAHFTVEESVLLPELPLQAPGPEYKRRILDDHAFLRLAMSRLAGAGRRADAEERREVGRRLTEHVRLEEREVFPFLEAKLDARTLETIGASVARLR